MIIALGDLELEQRGRHAVLGEQPGDLVRAAGGRGRCAPRGSRRSRVDARVAPGRTCSGRGARTQRVSGRIRPVCSAMGDELVGHEQPAASGAASGTAPRRRSTLRPSRRRPWAGSAGRARRCSIARRSSPASERRCDGVLGPARPVDARRRGRPWRRTSRRRRAGAASRPSSPWSGKQRDADARADLERRAPSISNGARSASSELAGDGERGVRVPRPRAAGPRTRRRPSGPRCPRRAARRTGARRPAGAGGRRGSARACR